MQEDWTAQDTKNEDRTRYFDRELRGLKVKRYGLGTGHMLVTALAGARGF